MATVETVRGPVDAGELGKTLMHEHVFTLDTEMRMNTAEWDEDAEVGSAIEKLNELKASGVDTLVDVTVLGLGRYVPRIQKIADATELNIVVATGIYTYDDLPMQFMFRGPGTLTDTPETMDAFFVRELTEGIADTGVKAAIIKCATDKKGVTPGIERILRCAARAHRTTGAPITTHTDAESRRGLEQQDVFESEGVDLSRVIIGHCGDSTDLDYLEAILSRGSFIGMDRFGIEPLCPLADRIKTVAELCSRGYVEQLLLSHDAMLVNDLLDAEIVEQIMPHHSYLLIGEQVVPALKEQGVSDDQITQMLVRNPLAVWERASAY